MKVNCEFETMVPISELKENPKNRNKHSQEQITRLAEILRYQGWRHPIIVSKRSGNIVAGHGRFAAAKLLELKDAPVDFQDFSSDDEELAFGISDNSIAFWAELDFQGINSDLALLSPDFNIDLLGIKNFILEPLDKLGSAELKSSDFETFANKCPRCGFEFDQFKNKDDHIES
jgi:hypothetical protein